MLKFVVGLGVVLMLAGFGAAGWQYVQSLPQSEAVADAGAAEGEAEPVAAPPPQDWLISPTGGLVLRSEVQNYLLQDRFVESRTMVIVRKGALADLLAEGEKLPEPPYLEVLADIRAPKLAEGACSALQETLALDCAVHSARVVEGSVEPAAGTAEFRIELAFTLKPVEEEMPDLSARVWDTETVGLTFEAGEEGAGTVPDLIRAATRAAAEHCEAEAREVCRVMRLSLSWAGDGAGAARVEIGSLSRLPKGMYPAPPLG